MPYEIEKEGRKFFVVKHSTGKRVSDIPYPSRSRARAQIRVLELNEANKSGVAKQAEPKTRDEVLAMLQDIHDIVMELGATCDAENMSEGSAEEEAAESPEKESAEQAAGVEASGSPAVGSEEYAAGTSNAAQARASREQMNQQYQAQQTKVNESAPGTEPRPGYSRNPQGNKSADVIKAITERPDVTEADKERAASEAEHFADPKNKKYKLDTEDEIRAAWNYIHHPDNAAKYSAEEVKIIKGHIIAAWKKKIDKEGPPSADEGKSASLKAGDVTALAKHMKDKYGADPGFFTKCMGADETADASDREALCAQLHYEVVGSWPAEHKQKSVTDILSINYIKSLHVPDAEQLFRDVIAVKSIGQDTVKGYLALWGDPERVDIESEFFTGAKSTIGATDFWDKSLALPRPLTWDHAQDGATKQIAQVGALVELGDDDSVGRWYVAQLDRAHRYRKAIDKLVSQRALGTSSDSAPQYVIRQKVDKGATWLKQWPLFAAALTTTPCEPRMIGSVDYFKSLGIDLGELATGTEAAQREAQRAELEKRVQSLQKKERLLKLYL